MIITKNAFLPCLFFNICVSTCLFNQTSSCHSTGGAKDAGEARPAREQKHICTVWAECTVGAAGLRQRSDRRHPDKVRKVNVSHHPVKQTDASRKSDTIKPNLSESARSLSYLSLVRRMWTEWWIVYLSSLVQFPCWTLSSILDNWWPCLVLLVKHDTLLGNLYHYACLESQGDADVIW